MGKRAGKVAAVLIGALMVAGCGLGAGRKTGEASLRVTDSFGARQIGAPSSGAATESETAMRQLERAHRVTTRYGGGFVQSIDGLSGGSQDGHPVDWFFFVDGIESQKGAADVTLRGGDSVWWDRREWGAATHVPAVVGQWPAPFSVAPDGKRLAVRLVCESSAAAVCDSVEAKLVAAGASPARGMPGMSGKGSGLRVLVGTWAGIGRDQVASTLVRGPGASGVYVRPLPGASGMQLLDQRGRTVRTYGAGTGLVAATSDGQSPPTWIVSGVDAAGLERAVDALSAAKLARRYAVLVTDGEQVVAAPEVDR